MPWLPSPSQASQLPMTPPSLDISRLLLCQGPHTFPLPIQLPTSAQLPDRLQHLCLRPLEVLCSLRACTHRVLTQTTFYPKPALPSSHPLSHTFLSTCSLALRPVPPARSRYRSDAWSRAWPPATVASSRQRQAPNTILPLPREGLC